jgi:ABC-type Fe3+-hydroxamate transport system substrate-binding protein
MFSMKAYCLIALLLIISGTAFSYERIISLAPSLTRDIYLLEMQDKLVGVTRYCPEFASGKENIGSVLSPNLERIAALKPDLVLATKDGNDRRTVDKLRSMGITVYVVESPSTFDDICSGFVGLGKYLDVEMKAVEIVSSAQNGYWLHGRRFRLRRTTGCFGRWGQTLSLR